MDPLTPTRPFRYDGIDNFRPFAALGIVILYLAAMTGTKTELGPVLLLRDCALPFFVMAAFFLQTRASMRGPGRGYADFLRKRALRIGAPFLFWTAVYVLAFDVLTVWKKGGAVEPPAPSMLLTGHSQLWFLSFILLAAAALFPLVRVLSRWGGSLPAAAGCVAMTACWAVFLQARATEVFASAIMDGWDMALMNYLDAAATYLPYAFAGIGFALAAEPVARAYSSPAVRVAATGAALAASVLHIHAAEPWTRMLFSLTVFWAALQPWAAPLTRALRPVAARSFSIYIVFKPVMVLFLMAANRAGFALTPALIPLGALAVLAMTWAAVAVGQRLLPWSWLLPPNEVAPVLPASSQPAAASAPGVPARSAAPVWRAQPSPEPARG